MIKPLESMVNVRPESNPAVANNLQTTGGSVLAGAAAGKDTEGTGRSTLVRDAVAASSSAAGKALPQLRQKLKPSSFFSPHLGHLIPAILRSTLRAGTN